MTERAYRAQWSRSARRAVGESLPEPVAVTAAEFISGPLLGSPRRVGKPLRDELDGIHSARLGRSWRVLYEIDEGSGVTTILDIRHRADAYHRR